MRVKRPAAQKKPIQCPWPELEPRPLDPESGALTSLFPLIKIDSAARLKSKVVYKASCWDCDDCHIEKTKRRLHDRKTEHFKALTSNSHSSAIADHMTQTGHRIKVIP